MLITTEPKVFLVEGPDNAGKTLLCNNMMKVINCNYIHLGRIQNVDETYIQVIKDIKYNKSNYVNTIIDRAYISNTIYAGLYKDTPKLSTYLYNQISDLVDKVVICLPADKKAYLEKYKAERVGRDDIYDDMSKVYDQYKKYYKKHSLDGKVVLYDYTKVPESTLEEYAERLVQC